MTGLFLLLVLGLWVWLAWRLAGLASGLIAPGRARTAARLAWVACLLPLPLADEIYSLPAARRLCQTDAELVVSDRNLAGQTVWYVGGPARVRPVGLLQARQLRSTFVLAGTQTPAFEYSNLSVEGGRLVRALGMSDSRSPLIFDGFCQPKDLEARLRRLQVVVVDKPR